jgi:DNA-binding response OmpR family regulator
MPKRILVVAPDPTLKSTRAAILKHQGYEVEAVETPDQALARLEAERFDLVLLGRKQREEARALDAEMRQKFPDLPILKIAPFSDPDAERYATRSVDPYPRSVIDAVRELLGE